MFKLMIADDNKYILQDLVQHIDWASYDLELLGGFENGQELFDAAKENMPDVIITDIVMPVLDGFQLTTLLYKQNPQVKVIFISGHQEFEYATNALKLHVFDYLTKPISSDQLTDILERLLPVLRQEQEQRSMLWKNRAYLEQLRRTSLSHYISRLLFYPHKETQIRKELDSLGLVLPKPFDLYVAHFQLHRPYRDDFSEIQLDSTLGQCAPDILIPLITEKEHGALLLIYANQVLSISDIMQRIYLDIERLTGGRVSLCYSNPTTQFSELSEIYKQADSALKQLLLSESPFSIASFNTLFASTVRINGSADIESPYSKPVMIMRKYIEENYMNPINANDVAQSAFLCTGHANVRFKNECNISIFGYIIWYRMKIAKQLLVETDLQITLIAERVGYTSKTSFYLAFKRNTGISPTEYREQHS